MSLPEELSGISSVFLDTAPVIYFIEAHPQFGPLMKEIIHSLKAGDFTAFTSVITITEVLPKPVSQGQEHIVEKFVDFLNKGENLNLLEISIDIAEMAGRLRAKYDSLKTMDALQLSTAIAAGADVFVTNDTKLKQVTELKVIVLKDYVAA